MAKTILRWRPSSSNGTTSRLIIFARSAYPFCRVAFSLAEDVERTAVANLKLDDLYKNDPNLKTLPPEIGFVAVINRKMAQLYWPKQDALGKVFHAGGVPVTVVGVVGDVKEWDIRKDVASPSVFSAHGGTRQ